jgi:hypothetical protein
MDLTVGTEKDYHEALKKMLPQGSYWDKIKADGNSDATLVLAAMAKDIRSFRLRMAQALKEAYPATAEETIESWERVLLGTNNRDLPLENRRALLLASSGFSAIYKITESFGVEISFEFPFKCGCFGWQKFGQQRLGAQNALSAITVNVEGGENLENREAFESAVESHLLANHLITFKYIAGERRFDSYEELSNAVKIDVAPVREYPPARFGRALFGRTRISAPYMADVAVARVSGWRSTWRRKDIERTVLETAGKFDKICFAYGSEVFYGGCKASASGMEFSSLAELSEHTGVPLSKSKPYKAARFDRATFGNTRLGSPESERVSIIQISGHGPAFRRIDIEAAALALPDVGGAIYFQYGKEAIYGGNVS